MKFVCLALVALMTSVAAAADAPDNDKKTKERDPDRVICRTEPVTGSRLAKERRCLKASEWAALKRENRDNVDKVQKMRWKNE